MADMLQSAAAWLREKLAAHASVSVVYRRGADAINLRATRGQTAHQATDDYGVVIETTSQDFIFASADLIFAGAAAKPQPGDWIEYCVGGNVYRYEVLPADGRRCYRETEGTLRVYTTAIDTG